MHYCMSKDELWEFISIEILKLDSDNKTILSKIEDAKYWETSIGCVTFFLAQIIERKLNNGENIDTLINDFYNIESSMFAILHEFNHEFICFLIRNVRDKNLTLEDEIVLLHTNMVNYNYDSIIRC